MNNIIILGNGFDLAHNLQTSYSHFIKYLFDKQGADRTACKDLFQFVYPTIKGYESFHSLLESPRINIDSLMKFSNDFIRGLIYDVALEDWCDIEAKYYKELKTLDNSPYYKEDPKKLNDQFYVIKKYLEQYLTTQKTDQSHESYRRFFELLDSSNTLIINFNYTDTLRSLYGDVLKLSKVVDLHGKLNNTLNPIIFGFAAPEKDLEFLRQKGNTEYMRNIKKHLYKQTSNEEIIQEFIADQQLKGDKIEISIMGHSCGESDTLILNQLFSHPKISAIRIFYYEERECFYQTQLNIYRILDGHKNYDKLVSFNDSSRMPQYSDFIEQKEKFDKYITQMHRAQNARITISPFANN